MGAILQSLIAMIYATDKRRLPLTLILLAALAWGANYLERETRYLESMRLGNELDLLERMAAVQTLLEDDERLATLYADLLARYENRSQQIYATVAAGSELPVANKFLTGGSVFFFAALISLFAKYDSLGARLQAIIILLLMGSAFGFIGVILPTLWHPAINYVGYPALQLFSLIAIMLNFVQTQRQGRAASQT